MLLFHLFRITVQQPVQPSLLHPRDTPADILKAAILQRPSAVLREGHTWHIGNVAELDEGGLYFALGRTTSSILGRYDSSRGDFIEEEFETAPYTHVVIDTTLEICAIAGKSKLAPTVPGIGRQLGKLLGNSRVAMERRVKFEVSEINDPEDFIEYLRGAYSIRFFAMTFRRPNPFDVNRDFQDPMQKFLQEAAGDRGKTAIEGSNLNPDVLEDLARSTAATGNDAYAKIQADVGQKPVTKRLSGNPASLLEETVDSLEERRGLLQRLRDLYARIRRFNRDLKR